MTTLSSHSVASAGSKAAIHRTSLPPHELDALFARVRRFIDEECIPREDYSTSHDLGWIDQVTRELLPKAEALGLRAPQFPPEWGGRGLNWQDATNVCRVCGIHVR